MQDIKETRLDNGLMVLTRETHAAPVAASWLWYRVGSRNERTGITGISHWVEHMLFKGTPRFGKGQIDSLITRNGGALNAMTWRDFTSYYEILPSDRFDIALEIEADRMANSLFDPQEVQSERTVIISEREGAENSPQFHLAEELLAAAFKVHTYGHETIGWKCDLESITRDDLYTYYRTYYVPNNAVLILVGDFDTARLLDRVNTLFGAIPAGPPPPRVSVVEPPQEGERRVVVRRPGGASYISVVFHAPAASHPDFWPVFVLSGVLSGVGSLNFTSPGASGKSARLYRTLVETGLAVDASSSYGPSVDPDLFAIHATAREGVSLKRIEAVILAQLDKLAKEPPTAQELATIKKQVKTQVAYSSDGVANLGYVMGAFEIASSYKDYLAILEHVEKVQPEDVQRVAATYLTELNRTVGWFVPTQPPGGGTGVGGPSAWTKPHHYPAAAMPTPLTRTRAAQPVANSGVITADEIKRFVLPNGITLLVRENHTAPVVSLRGMIKAGSMYDSDEKAGLAQFVADTLERGTKTRTHQEINSILDSLGATLGVSASEETAGFYGRCVTEDVDALLDIAADILLHPTFPRAEVEKVRGESLISLREAKNNTRWVASDEFHRLAYPPGHPYHRPSEGTEETVAAITRADLVHFHKTFYQPQATIIAVVGDVTPDEAVEKINRAFGAWQAQGPKHPFVIPDAWNSTTAQRKNVPVPGKTQADIVLGFPGMSRTSPDFYAASVGNMILGVLGMYGRLGENVRDNQGLAYYVYSQLYASVGAGPWLVRAGVNPANVEKAIASIQSEIKRFIAEPVTTDELSEAQDFLTGSLALRLETNDGVAGMLLNIELYDLGLDYMERYNGIIRSLTAEDLLAAARKYIDFDRCVTVVAGPV